MTINDCLMNIEQQNANECHNEVDKKSDQWIYSQ